MQLGFVEIWPGDSEGCNVINLDGEVEYLVYFKQELVDIFYSKIILEEKTLVQLTIERLRTIGRFDLLNKPFDIPWHSNNFNTHCWRIECDRMPINRHLAPQDGSYGNRCPNCHYSLRQHPFFGLGMEYDKGDPLKWRKWKLLNFFEKVEVYRRYGFPPPKRR